MNPCICSPILTSSPEYRQTYGLSFSWSPFVIQRGSKQQLSLLSLCLPSSRNIFKSAVPPVPTDFLTLFAVTDFFLFIILYFQFGGFSVVDKGKYI